MQLNQLRIADLLLISALGFFGIQSEGSAGGPVDIIQCDAQISRSGDGNGPAQIDGNCLDFYFEAAAHVASTASADGTVQVTGHRGLLLEKAQGPAAQGAFRYSVFAGQSTHLHSVEAISFDSVNHEIAAFDGQTNEVLFFNANLPGNVAPLRTLRNPGLSGTVALAIDSTRNQLVVLNGSQAGILFFSRLADVDGRKPSNQTGVLRQLRGPATQMVGPSGVALDPVHGEVFVSDAGGNQILVYDWNVQGNAAPLRIIRGPGTLIKGPLAVSYLPVGDQIQVINTDGSRAAYQRSANGDVAPLSLPHH